MKDIENGEFGSRNEAYTMNKHSGVISCVNSRCMTGRTSVEEKGWVRCHVIAAAESRSHGENLPGRTERAKEEDALPAQTRA